MTAGVDDGRGRGAGLRTSRPKGRRVKPSDMSDLIPQVVYSMRSGGAENTGCLASVIIVTYGPRSSDLAACLDGLRRQTVEQFEVILVENGSSHFREDFSRGLSLTYLLLDGNYGPSIARNLASLHAQSEILVFLEDDGVPHPDFLRAHLSCYENPGVVGARGACFSKSRGSQTPGSYYLGDAPKPALLNVEGNASVRKGPFIECGGWSNPIYGHSGIILTYKLTDRGLNEGKVIYTPNAIIHHDHNKRLLRWLKVCFIRQRNWEHLRDLYPDIDEFVKRYKQANDRAAAKDSLAYMVRNPAILLERARRKWLLWLQRRAVRMGARWAGLAKAAGRTASHRQLDHSDWFRAWEENAEPKRPERLSETGPMQQGNRTPRQAVAVETGEEKWPA